LKKTLTFDVEEYFESYLVKVESTFRCWFVRPIREGNQSIINN